MHAQVLWNLTVQWPMLMWESAGIRDCQGGASGPQAVLRGGRPAHAHLQAEAAPAAEALPACR